MVGVKLGDQRCFGGGRGGVVGYLPADAQLGVVAELPDPPPAAVAAAAEEDEDEDEGE